MPKRIEVSKQMPARGADMNVAYNKGTRSNTQKTRSAAAQHITEQGLRRRGARLAQDFNTRAASPSDTHAKAARRQKNIRRGRSASAAVESKAYGA